MAGKKPQGLNSQQRKFVHALVAGANATKAAIAAGYSEKTAAQAASRLLKNVKVADELNRLQTAAVEKAGLNGQKVLEELAVVGFSDVRHFTVSDGGELLLAEGAPEHAWRAVSSIKHKTTTITQGERETVTHDVELRLWPKTEALRMLGDHLALFPQKLRLQVGKDPSEMTDEELAAARKAVGLKA